MRVQRFLAPLLGMPVPEDPSQPRRTSGLRLPGGSMVEPAGDNEADGSPRRPGSGRNSLTKEDRPRLPEMTSQESVVERERRRTTVKTLLSDPKLAAMVHEEAEKEKKRASTWDRDQESPNTSQGRPSLDGVRRPYSRQSTPGTPERRLSSREAIPLGEEVTSLPEAALEVSPEPVSLGPPKNDAPPELVAQLRTQAFRCVVQNDCETLTSILETIDKEVWGVWENKAGKDLMTLAQERGSNEAYSVIAKHLGLLKETERESFEEREAVWVYLQGEVQPRRATVLEDTPPSANEVLLEYWDGDDPPSLVDRSMIRKSG